MPPNTAAHVFVLLFLACVYVTRAQEEESKTFCSWLDTVNVTVSEDDHGQDSCRWEPAPGNASSFWRCAAGACRGAEGSLRKSGTLRATVCDKHFTLASGSDRDFCVNGTWTSTGHECVPCGRLEQSMSTDSSSRDSLPWQGALYTELDGDWQLTCGATLISPTIVITAARCFTKAITDAVLQSKSGFKLDENIRIVFGKLTTSFTGDDTDTSSLVSSVKEVVVPDGNTAMMRDLALMVLSEAAMEKNVMPVCVDWKDVFPKIGNKDNGLLARWRTGSQSGTFQLTRPKYLDHSTCRSLASAGEKAIITKDKFCVHAAKGLNETVGSLTFIREGAHYLYGVFSARLPADDGDLLVFTSFLEDEDHRSWARSNWRRIHSELGNTRSQKGCESDTDCPEELGCAAGKCADPCLKLTCEANCTCEVVSHKPTCQCPTVFREGLKDVPKECEWPESPENGRNFKNCGRQLCRVKPGSLVPENTVMTTKCDRHYVMAQGEKESYCENGTWTDGQHRCIACGRSLVHDPALVHLGEGAVLRDFPWMAGLYYRNRSNQYELKCGGALVTNHIVLTAAHCLKDNGTLVKIKELKVGMGKLQTDFYLDESTAVVKNVREILVPDNYIGIEHYYALDIALLDLEDNVKISPNIMPACVDWDADLVLANGDTGYVAGYGLTDSGHKSDNLRWASQSYIGYSTCHTKITSTNTPRVTYDKFCISSIQGAKTDQGDSGGGLTFVKEGVHYVYGVVSTRLPSPNDDIVLFTSVLEHRHWLLDHIDNLRKKHFYLTQFDYKAGEHDVCKQVEDDLWHCVRQSQCPAALEAIKKGTKPKTCFSEDGSTEDPIVCCEPEEKITPRDSPSRNACKEYSESLNRQTYLCNLFRDAVEPNTWLQARGYAEFPHMAIVSSDNFKEWKYASLINELYLITEAYTPVTLYLSNKPFTKALVGMFHINNRRFDREYDIVETLEHPEFNRRDRYVNNIALLRLDKEVRFSASIRPICLHHKHMFPGSHVIMTGKIDNTVLFKDNTTVLAKSDCDEQDRHLDNSLVCVKVDNGNSVEGEVGSPLVVRLDEPRCMYGLVGVLNYVSDDPNSWAYTRIYHYIEWIEEQVWPKQPDT